MREIILGCIQGLTEFLPISSSGHLAIAQYFYRGFDDTDLLLDILLHLGTLFVVFIYYRKDIAGICRAALSYIQRSSLKQDGQEQLLFHRKLIPLIVVGTIPTGCIGLLLKSGIEESFASLPLIGMSLLVTGGVLFLADRFDVVSPRNTLSYKDALIIGTVQGIAVLPGISRSGSTISTGIFLGIERSLAARFSFLLSIPAILGAVILEGRDLFHLTQTPRFFSYFLGTLAAFITGYFAIAMLIRVVEQRKLSWFSLYCWLLGGSVLLYGLNN